MVPVASNSPGGETSFRMKVPLPPLYARIAGLALMAPAPVPPWAFAAEPVSTETLEP
jgi:hypothetical protein